MVFVVVLVRLIRILVWKKKYRLVKVRMFIGISIM